MKKGGRYRWKGGFLIACAVFLGHSPALAQARQEPGRLVGRVSTRGNLIVLELDEGVLGKANLFDLVGRTLRFLPEGAAYRAENLASRWDPEFGAELSGPEATLHTFPVSGLDRASQQLLKSDTGHALGHGALGIYVHHCRRAGTNRVREAAAGRAFQLRGGSGGGIGRGWCRWCSHRHRGRLDLRFLGNGTRGGRRADQLWPEDGGQHGQHETCEN